MGGDSKRVRLISTDYLAPVLRGVGIRDALTILAINAALAAWNMIVSLTCGMFSERMGRRFMWICSNAGMSVCFCFITGFAAGYATTGRSSLGIALVPFIFITYGFYDLAWIALNVSQPLPEVADRSGAGGVFVMARNQGIERGQTG